MTGYVFLLLTVAFFVEYRLAFTDLSTNYFPPYFFATTTKPRGGLKLTSNSSLQFPPSLASLYVLLKHEKFLLQIYMELTGSASKSVIKDGRSMRVFAHEVNC